MDTRQEPENASYAAAFDKGHLPLPSGLGVAVVACMDAGLDPARALGLQESDVHVIRNAGGVVSDDAIRSLTISQRLLGTTAIILIHHTDRGMVTFNDDDVKAKIDDVRQSIRRIRSSPYLATSDVRGFVYEAETGRLREVA